MPIGGPPGNDDEPDDLPDDLAIIEAALVAALNIDKDLGERQERLEKAKNDEKARREVLRHQEKISRMDKWAMDMAEIEIERTASRGRAKSVRSVMKRR